MAQVKALRSMQTQWKRGNSHGKLHGGRACVCFLPSNLRELVLGPHQWHVSHVLTQRHHGFFLDCLDRLTCSRSFWASSLRC